LIIQALFQSQSAKILTVQVLFQGKSLKIPPEKALCRQESGRRSGEKEMKEIHF